MVVGRSFWELPEELKAFVKRPAAHEWSADAPADASVAPESYVAADEETRRRREQVLQQQQQQPLAGTTPGTATLQERMAAAAQRKNASDRKRVAADDTQSHTDESSDAPSDASRAYLAMVRQLQHVDRQTDSTGAKWLVR